MFFFTKGYKAINPYRILFFYFLTFTYLLVQITVLYIEGFTIDRYTEGNYQIYLHTTIDWYNRYDYVRY